MINSVRRAAVRRAAQAALFWVLVLGVATAAERIDSRMEFHLPSQPMDEALLAFSSRTGMVLVAVGDFSKAGRSVGVNGIMTPEAALRLLLGNGPFEFSIQPDGIVTVSQTSRRRDTVNRKPQRADEPAPIAVTDLSTLVVTARKRDERLIDVPISLSAVSGEWMEMHGIDSAADVARFTPGVASVDSGGGFTQLQIRGVSSSLGGNDNGYYLDDVAFTGLTVPWHPDTRSFDLERIEILKGPQGTLFGEGSLGGTIRIVTRAPELDRFAAKTEAGYMGTQGGGHGMSAKAMVNMPLARDHLAVRVVATREALPGWIDGLPSGRRNANRQEIDTRRARLRWSPNDRWITDLTHVSSIADAPGGDYSGGDHDESLALLETRSEWTSTSLVSSHLSSASRYTYVYSDSSVRYAIDGRVAPTVDLEGMIGIGVTTHEFRWAYSIGDRLDWIAGYSHRRAARRDSLTVDGLASLSRQSNQANTVYSEATLRSKGLEWSLTAGLRYFIDDVSALSTEGGDASAIDSTFRSISPRLILARQTASGHQLYAAVSSGFRSGQLQPVTSVIAAKRAGIDLPTSIAPDEIRSYEIGYKHLLAQGRLLMQSAVFQSRWKGLPVRIPIDDVTNGVVNSRGAIIHGVEAGLSYTALPQLSFELGASVVDAVYAADVPGTPLLRGSPVFNVPRISASVSASYARELSDGRIAVASTSSTYNSRRETPLNLGSSADAIVAIGARLGIESPNGWGWYAYGDNLGNERGAVDGRTTFGSATRLRPRTYGFELRYTY